MPKQKKSKKTKPIIRWMWKCNTGLFIDNPSFKVQLVFENKPFNHRGSGGRYVRVRITEIQPGRGKR